MNKQEKNKERVKKYRELWKSQGLCLRCAKIKVEGKSFCEACSKRINELKRERREKRIKRGLCSICGKSMPIEGSRHCQNCFDKVKKINEKRIRKNVSNGMCRACGKDKPEDGKKHCQLCNVKALEKREKVRQKVFAYYGDSCVCCGEHDPIFLCIDHINNDGKKHREVNNVKTGNMFYRWLVKNNFPSGFQVLCYNCNTAKSINNGVCPHQTKIKKLWAV